MTTVTGRTSYVALLRAVNVGGTGKLPMAELRRLCEEAGFGRVRTFIASGNVVFESDKSAKAVKQALEERLEAWAGKLIGVTVRTAGEMAAVAHDNPFSDAAPNQCVAIFLDEPPPADADAAATGRADERIALGRREIYVDYRGGMGRSKLRIPAARHGTARNMNSVRTLAAMAAEPEQTKIS